MLNDLLLLSGIDIPFPAAQVNIHQPTIKEIAYIGEESFFIGCELLKFSKNKLSLKDKANLENQTDFDIIMSIMKDTSDTEIQKSVTYAKLVLLLLFPNYDLLIEEGDILFTKNIEVNHMEDTQSFKLDNTNYDAFKEILISMFCLQQQVEAEYNPGGELAERIVNKLRKGKAKVAQQKPQEKITIFGKYISILSVGLTIDMNTLLNYTVYQLFDEFERFRLKMQYDIYISAKMAGASGLNEVEDWMKNLHK